MIGRLGVSWWKALCTAGWLDLVGRRIPSTGRGPPPGAEPMRYIGSERRTASTSERRRREAAGETGDDSIIGFVDYAPASVGEVWRSPTRWTPGDWAKVVVSAKPVSRQLTKRSGSITAA